MAEVVGSLASVASILLNISPFRDTIDIHKTRCVNERSILPYCMMMVDGANWVLYACLIDDAFPIGVTNAFGFLAGTTYAAVYLRNCWNDKRPRVRKDAWFTFFGALAIMALIITSAVLIDVLSSRDAAADHIGYVVDFFNILLYSSPLELAWKVHRTRSTSGMYLPLSLTITAASVLWATYGFLTLDWFVAAPQSVGFLAGVVQLLLFLRYGVADNNQPSEPAASVIVDPNSADGSHPFANGDSGEGEKDSDPPPSTDRQSGSANESLNGQLRQPLISGAPSDA